MTARQLTYAIEAERQGSLNGAAKQLFVSQSSLSTAIRELENELGFPLFERLHTGIRVTLKGQTFLERARQVMGSLEQLERDYVRETVPVSRLSIATVQSSIVPTAFARFSAEAVRGNMRLRLRSRLFQTSEVVAAVQRGEDDLGIIYTTTRQERVWQGIFEEMRIKPIEVFKTPLYFIMSAGDPLAARESLSFGDLSGYTFAYSGDGGLEVFSNVADYNFWDFDLESHSRYIDVQDNLQLNQLLVCGGFFSIGHRAPQNQFYSGLAYVPARMTETVKMFALRGKSRPETPEMSKFLSILSQTAKEVIG